VTGFACPASLDLMEATGSDVDTGGEYKMKKTFWAIIGVLMVFFGIGGGIGGPNIADNGNSLYPFVRFSFGMGGYKGKREGIFSAMLWSVYFDYNFDDNGFK
jgi:hypothetical protein